MVKDPQFLGSPGLFKSLGRFHLIKVLAMFGFMNLMN